MVFTAWGLAGIIGPLMAGWVVDATGSYHLSYIACAVLLVIAGGLSFSLRILREDLFCK